MVHAHGAVRRKGFDPGCQRGAQYGVLLRVLVDAAEREGCVKKSVFCKAHQLTDTAKPDAHCNIESSRTAWIPKTK